MLARKIQQVFTEKTQAVRTEKTVNCRLVKSDAMMPAKAKAEQDNSPVRYDFVGIAG